MNILVNALQRVTATTRKNATTKNITGLVLVVAATTIMHKGTKALNARALETGISVGTVLGVVVGNIGLCILTTPIATMGIAYLEDASNNV